LGGGRRYISVFFFLCPTARLRNGRLASRLGGEHVWSWSLSRRWGEELAWAEGFKEEEWRKMGSGDRTRMARERD
jgi:hypothetical protein